MSGPVRMRWNAELRSKVEKTLPEYNEPNIPSTRGRGWQVEALVVDRDARTEPSSLGIFGSEEFHGDVEC